MKQTDTDTKQQKRFLTTNQAAVEWQVSRWWIYDRVKEGKLRPLVGMGKSWRFLPNDIDSLLERL